MKISSILETDDLTIFKPHPLNRELRPDLVDKHVLSLKKDNLLCVRPVLVDTQYRVLDGQHKIAACKRLKIAPVSYQIVDDPNSDRLIYVLNANAQGVWTTGDFVHFQCASGNEDYIKLASFMSDYGLSGREAAIALGCEFSGCKKASIRTGEFKYPDDKEMAKRLEYFNKYRKICEFMKEKALSSKCCLHITYTLFMRAMISFISRDCVDFDVFMNKLSYNLQRMIACRTLSEYTRLFTAIYNFRNSSPIPEEGVGSV